MSRSQAARPGAALPAQTSPGVEAAALFTEPLPVDDPQAHRAPVNEGESLIPGAVIESAAKSSANATEAEAQEEVGRRRSAETPAQFDAALRSRAGHEQQRDEETELIASFRRWLGTRLDRTKGLVVKVIIIYILFVLGEVALNSSAGVANGEVPLLAVVSFVGLAAGTVAIGWVLGSQFRDAVDRYNAGELPGEAEGKGMEALFVSRGKGRFSVFGTEIAVWTVLSLVLAAAAGQLIAEMRQEAGMTAAWGLVSFALAVIACAPPFLLRNRAADLLEAAQDRLADQEKLIVSDSEIIDAHVSAQELTQAHVRALPNLVNAQYLAAWAGGWGQLVKNQSHIVGQTMSTQQLPVVMLHVEENPLIASDTETLRPQVTDYERARERAGLGPVAGVGATIADVRTGRTDGEDIAVTVAEESAIVARTVKEDDAAVGGGSASEANSASYEEAGQRTGSGSEVANPGPADPSNPHLAPYRPSQPLLPVSGNGVTAPAGE